MGRLRGLLFCLCLRGLRGPLGRAASPARPLRSGPAGTRRWTRPASRTARSASRSRPTCRCTRAGTPAAGAASTSGCPRSLRSPRRCAAEAPTRPAPCAARQRGGSTERAQRTPSRRHRRRRSRRLWRSAPLPQPAAPGTPSLCVRAGAPPRLGCWRDSTGSLPPFAPAGGDGDGGSQAHRGGGGAECCGQGGGGRRRGPRCRLDRARQAKTGRGHGPGSRAKRAGRAAADPPPSTCEDGASSYRDAQSYTAKRAAGDLMLKLRELSPRRRAGFSGEGSSTRPSAGLGGLEACRWPPCSFCSTGRILPHG